MLILKEATDFPSGAKARAADTLRLTCGLGWLARGFPLHVSQSTTSFPSAVTRVLPSGERSI